MLWALLEGAAATFDHLLFRETTELFALAVEAHADGLEDDLPVYEKTSLLDVLQVQLQPLFEGEVIAVGGDLPVAAQARGDVQALLLIVAVLGHFSGEGRSGADDAHVAFENIYQLGQLVQAGFADELTHSSNPGVIPDFENGPIHFVLVQQGFQLVLCIGTHGAEFIEIKRLSVPTGSLLNKNRAGGGIVNHNGQGDNQHQRRQDNQSNQGKKDILGSSEKPISTVAFQILVSIDACLLLYLGRHVWVSSLSTIHTGRLLFYMQL